MVFRERRERVHRRLLQCPRSRWPHSGRRKRPPSEHMQVEGAVIRPGSNQQPGFGGLSRPWNRAGPSAVEFVIDQEPETLIRGAPSKAFLALGGRRRKPKERTLIGPTEAPRTQAALSRNGGRNHPGEPTELKSECLARSPVSRAAFSGPPEARDTAGQRVKRGSAPLAQKNMPIDPEAIPVHARLRGSVPELWWIFQT